MPGLPVLPLQPQAMLHWQGHQKAQISAVQRSSAAHSVIAAMNFGEAHQRHEMCFRMYTRLSASAQDQRRDLAKAKIRTHLCRPLCLDAMWCRRLPPSANFGAGPRHEALNGIQFPGFQ